MSYSIGNAVRLSATFTDVNGAFADPGNVTVRIERPSGDIQEFVPPIVVRESAGIYHCDVTIDAVGQWRYRFIGSSPVIAADEGEFTSRGTHL